MSIDEQSLRGEIAQVERLARRMTYLYLHRYGTLPVRESFDRIAEFILRHYVPKPPRPKRPKRVTTSGR